MLRSIAALSVFILTVFRSEAVIPDDSIIVKVGRTQITVPVPAGLARCDRLNDEVDRALKAFLPAEARLLACFGPPEKAVGVKDGNVTALEPALFVLTPRDTHGVEFNLNSFEAFRKGVKRGVKEAADQFDELARRQSKEGLERVSKDGGAPAEIEVAGVELLGVFEDSPTSYGVSSLTTTNEKGDSGAIVTSRSVEVLLVNLVKGRVLMLKGEFPWHTEEDRKAAEKTMVTWRNAIMGANPWTAPEDDGNLNENAERARIFLGVAFCVILFLVVRRRWAG